MNKQIRLMVGIFLAGMYMNQIAYAGGLPFNLPWGNPKQFLEYESCGCADGCWTARVRNKDTKKIEAQLHCDCETLTYSVEGSPDAIKHESLTCEDFSEKEKFRLIPIAINHLFGREKGLSTVDKRIWQGALETIEARREEIRLLKAAESGDVEAMDSLAQIYILPASRLYDPEESVKWLHKAAESADYPSVFAAYLLAQFYARGEFVPENAAESEKWAAAVAKQNSGMKEDLEKIFLIPAAKRRGETVKLLHKAAEQPTEVTSGFSVPSQNTPLGRTRIYPQHQAQLELGERYRRGQGVPQDDKIATKWLTLAAEGGEPLAQVILGVMYRRGQGVPKSESEAMKWFGTPKGRTISRLRDHFLDGDGVPRNKVVAQALFYLELNHIPNASQQTEEGFIESEAIKRRLTLDQIQEAQRLAEKMADAGISLGVLEGYLAK